MRAEVRGSSAAWQSVTLPLGYGWVAVAGAGDRSLARILSASGWSQLVEDGQRLLPGLPGLRELAGGLAGVAEVGEGAAS